MKQSVVGMTFVVSLLVIGYGIAQSEWKELRSQAGGFSVQMPGSPEESKQTLSTDLGPVDAYMFTLDLKESAFIVSYNDYPEDAIRKTPSAKLLDAWRDGFAGGVKGKVRSEKNVTLGGNPGREVIVDAPDDLVLKVRSYLMKNRLYQVLAVVPKGKESSQDVTKFLDSFKLLAAEADGWKEFISKAGRFSMRMPGTPTEGKQPIKTEIGEIELRMFTYEVGKDLVYVVIYNDYPADVIEKADKTKVLDGARDGAVANSKGKLRSEKDVSINGSPGREIVVDLPGGSLTIRTRMYLVKNRLYQVMAVTPQGKETSKDVEKFLESFKVTP